MPLEDLSGWNLRSLACGPATFAVAADSSVITWGAATNGELAYGKHGKKSSARPDKVCGGLGGLFLLWGLCGTFARLDRVVARLGAVWSGGVCLVGQEGWGGGWKEGGQLREPLDCCNGAMRRLYVCVVLCMSALCAPMCIR